MQNLAVLQGIRVIDWTGGPASPRATALLADYGAEVIRIQEPSSDVTVERDPTHRAVFDRSKQTEHLDTATAEGAARLLDLVSTADVLVISQAPGTAESVGLDGASGLAMNPRLVHCELTAFGPALPGIDESLPAYEALVHAVIGTMAEQVGYREPPIYEGLPFAEIGWAYLAQIAILAALYRRRIDGLGRRVETSMFDGALSFLAMLWGHADVDEVAAPMAAGAQRLVSRTFLCSDNEYLGVHTGAAGAFGRLMSVLGLDDRVPASSSGVDIGVPLTDKQRRVIDEEVPAIFGRQTRKYWLDALFTANVCAIPVLRPAEVFDEPQVRHNGMVDRVEDPHLGVIEQVAAPIRFGDAVTRSRDEPHWHPADGSVPLLRGLKVLDLGVWYAAGYSSRMLADLGADVVKIEPVGGDQMRGMRRPFQSAHSRKRSFVADLKHPDVQELVPRLLSWADVIHHNMRPGVAERLGMGFEQAKAINPEIVYLHAPGWGTTGPDTSRQSFAPLMSGFVGASYEAAGRFNPPTYPVGNEDPGGGMLGAIGLLMALANLGGARYIELPQMNAAMNQTAHIVRAADGHVFDADRLDPLQLRRGPLDGLYQTGDGWICLVVHTRREAIALGRVLRIDNVWDLAARDEGLELVSLLEQRLAEQPTERWLRLLRENGVPAVRPLVEHNNRAFHGDPVHHASRRVSEVGFNGGRLRQIDTLVRVDGVEPNPFHPAPDLGQHTIDLLMEVGVPQGRIAALVSAGTVRTI